MPQNTAQTLAALRLSLKRSANPRRSRLQRRFFKTGAGEYGAGDRFLGLTVPTLRALAKQYRDLCVRDVNALLHSPWHEQRLLALLIWVDQYRRGDAVLQRCIHRQYLRNLRYINNWDLVDSSAEHIVGGFLMERDKRPLLRLARSTNLWARRIAVLATFHFIRRGRFTETLKIAASLLHDEHDLIHKAVGWMLREVGKRDRACLENFLARYRARMPRTMLRYAIEHFPKPRRRLYLQRAAEV